MTGPSTRAFICGLISLFLLAASATAQLIGPAHQNDNYPGPEGEGFLVVNGEPGGSAEGPSADFPNGAWNLTTAGLQRYKSDTAPILGDFTFTLRGLLSSNQNAEDPGTNPQELRVTGLGFVVDAVENANPRYSFGWNEQLTRVIMQHDAQSGLEAQFVALDATQVHVYQLIRQGSAANVYVDGIQQISFVDEFGADYGQGLDDHTGLFFGSLSSTATSQSDSTWDLIQLENGVNVFDPNAPPDTVFTWGAGGSGDWNLGTNWTPLGTDSPPNNNNETAIFGDSIGANSRTVFSDSNITVNSVQFQNTVGGTYAVAGSGSIDLASTVDPTLPTIQVSNGGSHQFQAKVNLQNDTTATIETGSTLTFTNSLNLNGNTLDKMGAGSIALNNSLSTGGGTFNCNEGTCSGAGAISGNLNNNGGTVSPGNSPGVMTVEGNFSQAASGTLFIELAGTTAGTQYDVLQVEGEALLSGILEVSLLDGFEPIVGDTFGILELGSIAGEFDQVILPALAGGLAWDDSALTSQGSLSVVPEPATALLMSLGLLATVGSFWRRPSCLIGRSLAMSGSPRRLLIGSFFALLFVAKFASAQTIIPPTHTGANDPATEGFTLFNGTIHTLAADGGQWRMDIAGNTGYSVSPAIQTGDGDFTFTAIGTVNDLTGANADLFGFAFLPGDPGLERNWKTNFLADGSGLWDRQAGKTPPAGGTPNSSYTVPGGVGIEHTYQVVREGTEFRTYVDGIQAFVNVEGGGGTFGNLPFNMSNQSSAGVRSDSHWSLWQFEDGINIVPEPSSLMLLAVALIGLIGTRRRR